MTEPRQVFLRVGDRFHVGFRRGDELLTAEADNLDDALEVTEATLADIELAEVDQLCARCFPSKAAGA